MLESGSDEFPRCLRGMNIADPRLRVSFKFPKRHAYPRYWRCFNDAAIKAGVGALGTHTLRHTYRSWMDSVGTPIAVQQKLMRHSDIRTTMNVYGDVVDDRIKEAHSKVAALVFTSTAPEKGRSEQGSEDHSSAGSTPRSV